MKIAIYGDSFGCINAENISDAKNHSWPFLLNQLSTVESVDNYSKIAESFMSTYSKYVQHKHKYDVNIFLVTKIGRIHFPMLEGICTPYYSSKVSVHFVRNQLNKVSALTDEQRNLANKLFDYADIYFDNIENFLYYEHLARQALVEKAMNFSNYTIFIPCFDAEAVPYSRTPLVDIFNFENEHLKINEKHNGKVFGEIIDGKFAVDIRQCHLTKENNKLVLDKILQAIETKSKTIDLKLKYFNVPDCNISECIKWMQAPR